MKVKEFIKQLEKEDDEAEIIIVVYTADGYESGYVDRIDSNPRYNSVTKEKLKEDEKVVEITTTTKVS